MRAARPGVRGAGHRLCADPVPGGAAGIEAVHGGLAGRRDTTLGTDLGVAGASTDDVYAAMDWLVARQRQIEAGLAGRHLAPGGIAMFDLSSSWVEGSCCELAAFGHSRDGKRGRKQIEYGLLTGPQGRPVAVEVFPANTSDPDLVQDRHHAGPRRFRHQQIWSWPATAG